MTPLNITLYGLTLFAWSTSWLALKMQLGVVEPEISVMWRFILAAALMFAVTRWRGRPLWIPLAMQYRPALLGLFLFSLNFSLYYHAGIYVSSGLLAVAFAICSIVLLLMEAVWNRHAIRPAHLLAAVMGVAGVAVLYAPELAINTQGGWLAIALCMGGTLSFATGSMVSASSQRAGLSVMTTTAWGMVYGAVYLAVWNLIEGHAFIILPDVAYLGSLVWLAVISSVVAFTAYLTLVGNIGVERAGYITVLFPVFALLISAQFEGYEWNLASVAGLVLVMAGNWLILRR